MFALNRASAVDDYVIGFTVTIRVGGQKIAETCVLATSARAALAIAQYELGMPHATFGIR